MISDYFAVIMAGGGGTRLWPLSRKELPKQMLKLGSEQTLFELAVSRLDGLFLPDHILVVTIAEQAARLQKLCPEIPEENFLLEPMPRGTASVVGLAALAIKNRAPNASMAILTADHHIENVPYFHQLLETAWNVASEGYLVTLGIEPAYPSTGYGYIERGKKLDAFKRHPVFLVNKFKEKPSKELAEQFISQGDHDWNSGMFIWRADRILQEFAKSMPELYRDLERIDKAWNTPEKVKTIEGIWPTIKPQTIDYGIMEHASQVAVLPAEGLGWNDVGSWDSLYDVLPTDQNGNIILSDNFIGIDTQSSLVCGDSPEKMIVTIGMEDLIVVNTKDALLICPKGDSQRVRELVKMLKERGLEQYL